MSECGCGSWLRLFGPGVQAAASGTSIRPTPSPPDRQRPRAPHPRLLERAAGPSRLARESGPLWRGGWRREAWGVGEDRAACQKEVEGACGPEWSWKPPARSFPPATPCPVPAQPPLAHGWLRSHAQGLESPAPGATTGRAGHSCPWRSFRPRDCAERSVTPSLPTLGGPQRSGCLLTGNPPPLPGAPGRAQRCSETRRP